MEKEGPSRALVVFGSESGTAEKAIKELAAQWKAAGNWQVVDVIDGNAAAKQGLATLSTNHDAIIIATSSFRQGDAPYNYDDFLGALYRATFKAESPFQGCQHAVLGFGDSHFDTYMNCPRLTDSLLEKCGSRRLVKRAEIDVREKDRGEKDMKTWAAAVDAALQNLPDPASKPACIWDENTSTYDKSLEYDDDDDEEVVVEKGSSLYFYGSVAAAAAAVYYFLFA